MPNSKIIVFLRAYNDVDHVAPVIYKLSQRGIAVRVVLRQVLKLSDYRLLFLATLPGVTLNHIDDVKLEVGYPRTEPDARIDMKALLRHLLEGVSRGVVVIDWVSQERDNLLFATAVIDAATKLSIRHIALPHGDAPYANRLIKVSDFDYEGSNHYRSEPSTLIAVPNKLCAARYAGLPGKEVLTLGSSRYSNEWMSIDHTLTAPYRWTEANRNLKICLLLRQPLRARPVNIYWEELLAMVRIVSANPSVLLVIKHHTRDAVLPEPTAWSREIFATSKTNVRIDVGEVNSSSLVRWADCILDIGTSASFEAIKLGKPVGALDYLHANVSVVAKWLPTTEIRCRDDLVDLLEIWRSRPIKPNYSNSERNAFLSEFVDYPDADVLERYATAIERLLN